MRVKILAVLAAVLLPSLAYGGTPVTPEGVQFQTGSVVQITDAVAAGTDTASVKRGRYLVCAEGEAVYVCAADTCATGGVKVYADWCLPFGWYVPETDTFSARSAGGTGDVQFIPYR